MECYSATDASLSEGKRKSDCKVFLEFGDVVNVTQVSVNARPYGKCTCTYKRRQRNKRSCVSDMHGMLRYFYATDNSHTGVFSNTTQKDLVTE